MRKRPKKIYNTEHLIPRCRWGSCDKSNLKRSKINEHNGKHDYLWTKLPHEQIMQILNDNYSTLCYDTRLMIKEEIEVILEYYLEWWEFYNNKCFKKQNLIPKKI